MSMVNILAGVLSIHVFFVKKKPEEITTGLGMEKMIDEEKGSPGAKLDLGEND